MSADPRPAASALPADAATILQGFEAQLDPARPAMGGGVIIVGYGEVSTVLTLALLPGWVCKRMAGFRSAVAVERYIEIVQRYLALLQSADVHVATTIPVPVHTPTSGHIVYLLQPRLDPAGLGHHLLRTADDGVLFAAVDRVLAHVRTLLLNNRSPSDGRTFTVDAQLSNWYFPVDGNSVGAPTLIDVGMPYMRVRGLDELDNELYLEAVPPGLRWYYRRAGAVEHYLDHYFEARGIVLDLLGNFHKEGRPDRIAAAVAHVNQWLAAEGADLSVRPIQATDVDRYYKGDAEQLELFLKVRRLDRFIRTRLLRQRYNFILPGPIQR